MLHGVEGRAEGDPDDEHDVALLAEVDAVEARDRDELEDHEDHGEVPPAVIREPLQARHRRSSILCFPAGDVPKILVCEDKGQQEAILPYVPAGIGYARP